MDKLLEFHVNNKYYVNVTKIENGCIGVFPANYFKEMSSELVSYKILDNILRVTVNNNNSVDYDIPTYIHRLTILSDIIIKAKHRQIPTSLILISDKDAYYNSLLKVLPAPKDENNKKLEESALMVYNDIMMGLFDLTSANKLGIERGYKFLQSLLENGGI